MKTRDEFWWAFLDGEMTSAESAQFDQSAAPEVRERLSGDLSMETELSEIFSAPVVCPKATWKAAVMRVQKQARAEERPARRLLRHAWLALPLAAMILMAVYASMAKPNQPPQPLFLSLKGQDITAVAAKSQVSDGITGVRAFMEQMALPVVLNPADDLDGQNAPYRLLGIRADQYRDERVVELLFDCEGEPASLIIVQKGGNAAWEIGKALAIGAVRASRSIGGVVVAVIGANAPRDLIHVVDDQWPEPKQAAAESAPEETPPCQETLSEASPLPDSPTPQDPGVAAPMEETPAPPTDEPILKGLPEVVATLV